MAIGQRLVIKFAFIPLKEVRFLFSPSFEWTFSAATG